MLHQWLRRGVGWLAAWGLAAWGLAAPAAADNARLRAPVTGEKRAALAKKIRPQLVDVQRISPPPRNVVIPGYGPQHGVGWWAARGRVMTASVFVQGWPRSDKDIILVRRPGGEWRPATVGLTDIRLGLAVLDVEHDAGDPPPPPAEPPLKGSLYGGQTVYTATRPDPVVSAEKISAGERVDGGLINVLIAGPAGGAWAYYWLVGGPVAIGTPLFDSDGRLVTLIGLRRPTGETMALPTRAIEALYERRYDWLP